MKDRGVDDLDELSLYMLGMENVLKGGFMSPSGRGL